MTVCLCNKRLSVVGCLEELKGWHFNHEIKDTIYLVGLWRVCITQKIQL